MVVVVVNVYIVVLGEKKKIVVCEGGGKKWIDDIFFEWDFFYFCFFVGNLVGEIIDDFFLKVFLWWKFV